MLDFRLGVSAILAAIIALFLISASIKSCSPVQSVSKSVSSQADDMPDLTKDENRPYRPVKLELFQPEKHFEVVGTDVTAGVGLRWVLVARNRETGDGTIFRVLVGDSFGPIERGRVVRIGIIRFWQNSGYQAETPTVLAIE